MSTNRCLLHKTKLEDFKLWCRANDIPVRPGKGDWQVCQVLTSTAGWQVIFSRLDMPEHLTVNKALEPLVREFIEASHHQDNR